MSGTAVGSAIGGVLGGAASYLLAQTAALAQAAPVQQAAQVPASPFFSNDFAGAVKVVIVFGGMVAAVATFFYKFTHGKVETDVNKVGEKLDDHLKKYSEAHGALGGRVSALERDSGRCIGDIGHLREGHGELKRSLETLDKAGTELHRDITSMILASQQALTASITNVQVQVAGLMARLEERDRLSVMLDRMDRPGDARGNAGRGSGA